MNNTMSKGVLVVSLFIGACAGRTAAWEAEQPASVAAVSAEDATALDKVAEELWAQRLELGKAEEAATAFAQAAAKATTPERLAKLARAYYFLADTHYALADRKDDMMKTYEKGLEAGEQGLVLSSPAFTKAMKEGAKVEEAIKLVDKDSVPAIYWYATNLGKWARAQGLAKLLFYKDKVRAYMERCNELDERYFYGAPPRYFGAMFAIAPSYAGGDLKKSEESFKKSLEIEPNYLATKVLMAENLMTKKQDRAQFEALLKEVQAADVNALPDLVPEQTFEKKKAELLLGKADDLF